MMKELVEYMKKLREVFGYRIPLGEGGVTIASTLQLILIVAIFFVASKYIRRLLQRRVLSHLKLDEGAQFVILRLTHFILITIGILLGFNVVGIELTSLVVIFGLIGVGIAFGLQNITSNFVSGIILLFERPVSVGDYIEVGEDMGQVRAINMRATTIVTRDNITLIVPNSSFIENTVTNWSVGDPKVRINIPVGVAYGSDTDLVSRLLTKIAQDHPEVRSDPEPDVLFKGFGDSSLDFELRIWILSPMGRFKVISELNYAIDAAFRENNVTVPFPQRDVHFYQEA